MSFLKKIFGKKEQPKHSIKKEEVITSFEDFWNWFLLHEQKFHNVVKKGKYIEVDFFDQMSPKLNQLREGIFFLCGMPNDKTVDLILTADGNIKNYYFIEELIQASPKLDNWIFKAHKPAHDIEDMRIDMGDFSFTPENINFYADNSKDYPDEISITIVHDNYSDYIKDEIINGCYIFLDNYLGELNLSTKVDTIEFIEKNKVTEELVPISKLKDFLIWREKEFIEKYEGVRHSTENDAYNGMQATLENGVPLIAIINSDLLEWDAKASHPWILNIEINYDGNSNNGMPEKETLEFLNQFEDVLMLELKDFEGYLNIGRQTADNLRNIYFACKEFRKPCKVLDLHIEKYPNYEINYEIYKDKYWQSLERFRS